MYTMYVNAYTVSVHTRINNAVTYSAYKQISIFTLAFLYYHYYYYYYFILFVVDSIYDFLSSLLIIRDISREIS